MIEKCVDKSSRLETELKLIDNNEEVNVVVAPRSYRFEYMVAISVTLLHHSIGNQFGWSGPTIYMLTSQNYTITVSNSEGSWLTSFLDIGSIFGTILAALLSLVTGRKTIILLATVPVTVGSFIFSISTNLTMLYVGRFLCGVSAGISRIMLSIYIGEIASPSIRGRLLSFIFIQKTVGVMLEHVAAPQLSLQHNGYFLMVTPVLCFLTALWVPESPYYLVAKQKLVLARSSLQKLRMRRNVTTDLSHVQAAVSLDNKDRNILHDLVAMSSNRRAFLLLLIIMFGTSLSGTYVILMYAQIVFKEINSSLSPHTSSIILAVLPILGGSIHNFTIDWWGRRPLILVSCFGSTVFLSVVACWIYLQKLHMTAPAFALIPVIAVFLNKMIDSVGIIPLIDLFTSELFNVKIKSVAACILSIAHSLMEIFVIKLFQIVTDLYGMHIMFWCFALCKLAVGVIMYFKMPETKNLTLNDVQKLLK